MKIRLALLLIAAFFLNGCATSYQQPLANSDYGPAPTNVEEKIRAYMELSLLDSMTAQYKFGEPRKAYWDSGLARGGKVTWQGYAVEFLLNAKNSLGGYVGYQRHIAIFTNDQVSDVIEPYRHIFWAE